MPPQHLSRANGWLRSRSGIVLVVFLGIAAFFLITEHTAHLLGILPVFLLILCPLLHFILHGRHGGGHAGHGGGRRQPPEGESDEPGDTDIRPLAEDRYLAQAWRRLWIAAVPTTLIMVLWSLR